MALIFLNSMFLAVYDYNDRDDTSERNTILNIGGRIFTILFTIEGLCKIIANGFVL
jgi:Ion transport protein